MPSFLLGKQKLTPSPLTSTPSIARKPIARSMQTREDKKLQQMFDDLSGKMTVPNIGGKWYTLIVRDDCTRFTRVLFLGKKSDAASAFESFPAEVWAGGTPSAVMEIRSDNGEEFFGGGFGKLCRKRRIKQEFTPADKRCSRTSIRTNQRHCLFLPYTSKRYYCTRAHRPTRPSGLKRSLGCATSEIAPQPQQVLRTSPHTRCGTVRLPPRGVVAVPQASHLQSKERQQVAAEKHKTAIT